MTGRDALARLFEALEAGDFVRLAQVFAPNVTFRASLPDEIVEAGSASEAAACFEDWFGDAAALQLLSTGSDELGDVTAFRYRMRAKGRSGWLVIQQAGAVEATNGRITAMRLACTGFQREPSD
ncbi:MAG: nuclear transport factor 2 family protein [Deinococcales bacterium]|jgi:ketosteroid isomerase-like protein